MNIIGPVNFGKDIVHDGMSAVSNEFFVIQLMNPDKRSSGERMTLWDDKNQRALRKSDKFYFGILEIRGKDQVQFSALQFNGQCLRGMIDAGIENRFLIYLLKSFDPKRQFIGSNGRGYAKMHISGKGNLFVTHGISAQLQFVQGVIHVTEISGALLGQADPAAMFLKERELELGFHPAEGLGAQFFTDAKVTEILADENGRTVGCVAERSDGSKITVNASKAVILTTGGFAANADLVYQYSNGAITTPLTSCAVSSTGDGIALAENVGAAMVDLDQIQVHPLGDPINDCGCVAEFVGNWLGAQYYMFVNKEGERFVKEDGTRYEMSMAELEQTDGQMWLIVDSSQIAGDDSRTEQIESLIASGHTYVGDTLEDLAEQIGIDPAALTATVEKYNDGMINGSDEFGKAASAESVIEVGPFYASLRTPTVHHTMGGVKINTDAQVLDAEGNVIPGFYAAGEACGGIHGNNRLGGNAYPDIMAFGRIAGINAAAE